MGGLFLLDTSALRAQPRPQPSTIHHDFLSAGDGSGAKIEYYWAIPDGQGPWPAVVLLHGHQEGSNTVGGQAFVDYGVLDTLRTHGYVGIAVSQPGYGGSDGRADFMGPRTVGAVEAVIRHFREGSLVERDRIALEGVSRGAIVASLVAARDTTIRAMVLISGAYDFVTALDSSTEAGRRNIARRAVVRADMAAETDGTVDALRTRSALSVVDGIRTPALILNGAKDDRTDPDQARALGAGIQRHGTYARVVIYDEFGHAIPYSVREREIRPFLERYLSGPGHPNH